MINNFDAITEAIEDVIKHTSPLLRNKQLFYAATEKAFLNYDYKNRSDTQQRISERVKNGLASLNELYNAKERTT